MTDVADAITTRTLPTARMTAAVHTVTGRDDGEPVVFIHGNVSSSVFYFPTMRALPERYQPIAIDLRGFGESETAPVDATRGARDFSDDVLAALDALGIDSAHLIGWSMGGGVVMQMAIDVPNRVRSLTLINPVSPYGFGGTRGLDGAMLGADGVGSGGGAANPDFIASLAAGDTSADSPNTARSVMRAFYVAPGWDGQYEDAFVDAMLSTALGDDNYPGDSTTSEAWPGIAPGSRGILNAMAPTRFNVSAFAAIDPRPPVLWLRGELDQIVSDGSMMDLANLGAMGFVPGYPGADICPPQPMVAQTRAVLDRYAAAGGRYTESVVAGAGHSPHIERPDEVRATLIAHLDSAC